MPASSSSWFRASTTYPELPGGKIGRAIEVEPFDVKRIGSWWDSARGQDGVVFPLKTDDVWLLSRAWSTPSGFVRGARFVSRALGGALRGQRLVGAGAALSAAMLDAVLSQQTPVWLASPVEDLVVEDGQIAGAIVQRDGRQERVRTTRGVVLAGGGFAHRTEWRREHHGIDGFSSASKGDLGTAIELGQRAGGAWR